MTQRIFPTNAGTRSGGSIEGHVRLRLHFGSVKTPWWDSDIVWVVG
jgi:hypothetical protein